MSDFDAIDAKFGIRMSLMGLEDLFDSDRAKRVPTSTLPESAPAHTQKNTLEALPGLPNPPAFSSKPPTKPPPLADPLGPYDVAEYGL